MNHRNDYQKFVVQQHQKIEKLYVEQIKKKRFLNDDTIEEVYALWYYMPEGEKEFSDMIYFDFDDVYETVFVPCCMNNDNSLMDKKEGSNNTKEKDEYENDEDENYQNRNTEANFSFLDNIFNDFDNRYKNDTLTDTEEKKDDNTDDDGDILIMNFQRIRDNYFEEMINELSNHNDTELLEILGNPEEYQCVQKERILSLKGCPLLAKMCYVKEEYFDYDYQKIKISI